MRAKKDLAKGKLPRAQWGGGEPVHRLYRRKDTSGRLATSLMKTACHARVPCQSQRLHEAVLGTPQGLEPCTLFSCTFITFHRYFGQSDLADPG